MFYLCNFSKNWGDEFDMSGSMPFTQGEKEALELTFTTHPDQEISIWFGANEGWEETVGEFKDSYTFTKISEATYKELEEKFPQGIGYFTNVTDYIEIEEEE